MTIELEREYERLQNIKIKLCKDISELEEKETFAQAKSNNYLNLKFALRKMPISWIDSVFFTRREQLIPYVSADFLPRSVKRIAHKATFYPEKYMIQYFALLCIDVCRDRNGVVLILQDPYRTIKTYPLDSVPFEKAMYWKGRIVIAKLRITPDAEINNEFFLEKLKVMNYTRDCEIDGTERKLIKNPLTNILVPLRKGLNISEQIMNLTIVEQYLNNNNFLTYRAEDTILHVISDDFRLALTINEKHTYCIKDEAHPLTSNERSFLTYNNEYILIRAEYGDLLDDD